MAFITLDPELEIDKLWHWNVEDMRIILKVGPYAKYLLDSYKLDDTQYQLVADNHNRRLYVELGANGSARISFSIKNIATGETRVISNIVEIEDDAADTGIATFLGKPKLVGKPRFVYRGQATPLVLQLNTLLKDTQGTVWRHTGHFDTTTKDPLFRATHSLSDVGLTITAIDTAHGPVVVYDPEVG